MHRRAGAQPRGDDGETIAVTVGPATRGMMTTLTTAAATTAGPAARRQRRRQLGPAGRQLRPGRRRRRRRLAPPLLLRQCLVAQSTRKEAAPTPSGPPRSRPSGHNPAHAAKRTVLLVEDETSITEPLAEALGREGFETKVAATAAEALDLAERIQPDLVLLDVMLPDGSGFDVCRELRQRSQVPIIMLTARGEEADRVVGLELGADDYIVKPFSAREVAARIRAVLRRADSGPGPTEGPIEVGELRLDPAKREVTKHGEALELSRKEFELLQLLMQNAGSVVTRERAIDEVWDTNWFGSTKTLDVHVSGLRQKLGDDSCEPRFLHTVRGVGFRFSSPEEPAVSLMPAPRLLGAFAYVLLLIIVALEVPLALNLARRVDAEVKNDAACQAHIVAAARRAAWTTAEAPQRLAQEAGSDLGARVIIVDRQGLLRADSAGPELLVTLVREPPRDPLGARGPPRSGQAAQRRRSARTSSSRRCP